MKGIHPTPIRTTELLVQMFRFTGLSEDDTGHFIELDFSFETHTRTHISSLEPEVKMCDNKLIKQSQMRRDHLLVFISRSFTKGGETWPKT